MRVLSAIMTVAILLTSLVIVVPTSVAAATTDAELWTNYAADTFEGGSGTDLDPYLIKTAEQLALLAKLINSGATDPNNAGKTYSKLSYEVIAPIDATAHQWVPIGNKYSGENVTFYGYFNGGNHEIKTVINNKTNQPGDSDSYTVGGLFGCTRSGSLIENVRLTTVIDFANAPLVKNAFMGGFVGASFGATFANCHVNVHSSGLIRQAIVFGGMIGYSTEGTSLEGCSVSGVIDGQNNTTNIGGPVMGGLIGRLNAAGLKNTKIENCVNFATITQKATGQQVFLGSFIGKIDGTAGDLYTVKNCANLGQVIPSANACGTVPYYHVGAFAGGKAANGVLQIDGFVNLGELRRAERDDRTNGTRVATAELIGTDLSNDTSAAFTVANYYTVNDHIPFIYRVSGNAPLNGTALSAKTYYNFEELVKDATIRTAVVDGDTVVSIPQGAMDILEKLELTITAARGDVTTAEGAENTAKGTYDFTLADVAEGITHVTFANGFNSINIYDEWVNYAQKPANGTGTKEDYWIINTAEELAYVAQIINNYYHAKGTYYVKLNADIDLAGRVWTPIGSYGNLESNLDVRFQGIFDGQNHTVNLVMTDEGVASNAPAALFGGSGGGAKIQNVKMTGSIKRTIRTNSNTSGTAMLLGFASGPSYVDNVHVDAEIDVTMATGTGGEPFVGGIVSTGNNLEITNSTMRGSVTTRGNSGNVPSAGGILGKNSGTGKAYNCINYADISLYADGTNAYAGGITAILMGQYNNDNKVGFFIDGCTNIGTVAVYGRTSNVRVGGILGSLGRNGATAIDVLQNCVNLGDVKVTTNLGGASGIGGIIGHIESKAHGKDGAARECATVSNIFSVPTSTAYGLVGRSDGFVNGNPATGYYNYEIEGSDAYFEMDQKVVGATAVVTVSKTALDVLLSEGVGYTMALTYGETVKADVADASVIGNTYVWSFDALDETEATLVLTKGEFEITPAKASWAGLLAADDFVNDDPATDEIEIATAGELALFAKRVNASNTYWTYRNKSIVLTEDIDLSGAEWTPIGRDHNNNFGGFIDGAGYTIKGLTLTASNYLYTQSFIGRAGDVTVGSGEEAVSYWFGMKDLTFEAPVLRTADYYLPSTLSISAVVVGALYGGTIDNVHVNDLDAVMDISDGRWVSGIAGYVKNASVINSSVSGSITATGNSFYAVVGGVAGRASVSEILNNKSDVAINVAITPVYEKEEEIYGQITVGGIIGLAQSDYSNEEAHVNGNTNTGAIDVTVDGLVEKVSVAGIVGGALAGRSESNFRDGTLYMDGNVSLGAINVTAPEETELVTAAGILGFTNYTWSEITNNLALTSDLAIGGQIAEEFVEEEFTLIDEGNVAIDATLDILADANIRVDLENQANSGIRFDTEISKAAYEALLANGYTVELGTYIAPTDLFKASFANAAKVVFAVDAANGVNGFIADDGDALTFGAALTAIKDAGREFSAMAYINITVDNTTYTIYSDVVEGITLAEVAQNALDSDAAFSTAQRNAIAAMIPNA